MKTYFLITIILFSQLLLSCNGGKQAKGKQTTNTDTDNQKVEVVTEAETEVEIEETQVDAMCDSCTAVKFRYIKLETDKLEENDIYEFLLCCNKSCAIDVEFSEFSNFLVFHLLENRPNLTITVMENNVDELPMDYIKEMIESPISDRINLQKIYLKVEKLESTSEIKDIILAAIKTAIDKY